MPSLASPLRSNLVASLASSSRSLTCGRSAARKGYDALSGRSVRSFNSAKTIRQVAPTFSKQPSTLSPTRNATTDASIAKPAKPITAPIAKPITAPVAKPPPSLSTSSSAPTPPSDLTSPANQKSLSNGLDDEPWTLEDDTMVDWSRSFHGLSKKPFSKEATDVLLQPLDPNDVEIKPDGIVYLPEIKYRRVLNRAFGPGGWGLAPRGETIVTPKTVTREYGLVVHGRLVSIARGEQQYFDREGIPTATEGCKSNALMRCSKDLGIASDLWDPVFIRGFMKDYSKQVWVEHVVTKKRRLIVMRKDVSTIPYPFKEVKMMQ